MKEAALPSRWLVLGAEVALPLRGHATRIPRDSRRSYGNCLRPGKYMIRLRNKRRHLDVVIMNNLWHEPLPVEKRRAHPAGYDYFVALDLFGG